MAKRQTALLRRHSFYPFADSYISSVVHEVGGGGAAYVLFASRKEDKYAGLDDQYTLAPTAVDNFPALQPDSFSHTLVTVWLRFQRKAANHFSVSEMLSLGGGAVLQRRTPT